MLRIVCLAGLVCMVLSGVAVAADDSLTVYRREQPDGSVEFSDKARSGAEAVVVEKPMIMPSKGLKLPARSAFGKEFSYRLLAIREPAAAQTFRNQEADAVDIVATVEPGLKSGDRVLLLLDGSALGQPGRGLSFVTPRLERGAHTLQLEIKTRKGETVMQSELVTIHVQRIVVARPAGGSS